MFPAPGLIRRAFPERPAMTQQRVPSPDPRVARVPLSAGHRAILVVLGMIAVSLCFGIARIVDVAISGALHEASAPARLATQASMSQPARVPVATTVDDRAIVDGSAISAVLVDVPSASAEAIEL